MEYRQVGIIVNTHGIKGDVKVLPLTDDVKRFEDLKNVYLGDDKLKLEIEKVGYAKGNVLLGFKNHLNINDVEKFKKLDLWINEEDKVELPKNSYFLTDILGLEVHLKSGEHLGTIVDILQPGANDVYVIKDGKKEYLIPAIKDVVVEVDLSENNMIIDPIEGMLDQ